MARCWTKQIPITPPTSAIIKKKNKQKKTLQPGQEQALEQEMNQGQIIQDTVTGERELERRARTWPFLNIHDDRERREM